MHPKQILQRFQIEPKKSLGQNFLFDENILARIASAANLSPDDQVLEIGPGLGSLTQVLAANCGRLVAVELDNRFLEILQAQLMPFDNVTIVHGDILKHDPAQWFDRAYKVVANVPYYITGAILRQLLSTDLPPRTIVLTVQKEVAERITASPPQMSLLAVSVQAYGQTTIVDTIKAGAFWPRPDIDSAIIRIELTDNAVVTRVDPKLLFRVVKAGFSQKRKQLKNNLRSMGFSNEMIMTALSQAGIESSRRAQTLALHEWESLSNELIQAGVL